MHSGTSLPPPPLPHPESAPHALPLLTYPPPPPHPRMASHLFSTHRQPTQLHPSEADEFIQDACAFLQACFRETDVRTAKKRRGGAAGGSGRGDGGGEGVPATPRRSARK